MKMKMNKNYIELFCTLKKMYTHFNQKTKLFKYLNNMISSSSTLCVN
jgi:hypothetical protein